MNQKEIDIAIAELEIRLERLRALYEQYFMGMERTVPSVAHKDVERRLNALKKSRFQNTAKRFKFQTLAQRYNTMQQYWTRICREIEEGRYRRHRLKAERTVGVMARLREEENREQAEQARAANAQAEQDLADLLAAEQSGELQGELDRALSSYQEPTVTEAHEQTQPSPSVEPISAPTSKGLLGRLGKREGPPDKQSSTETQSSLSPALALSRPPNATPPRPAGSPTLATGNPGQAGVAARPAARQPGQPRQPAQPRAQSARGATAAGGASGKSGLTADRIKQLHQSYAAARKKTNASAVSYEKLERSIRDTEKKLRQKHRGKNVDFDVVVKDGRAIIKPRLR